MPLQDSGQPSERLSPARTLRPSPGTAILRSLVTERAGGLIDQLRDTTGFLYEIGLLKRYKRTGWSLAGVPSPESVADHSFRASVIASVMAAMEGADPQRAAFLALWHDSQETRTTDIPHLTKNYVSVARNEQVTQGQVAPLPPAVASMISAAVAEYEAGETLEARCARDADKRRRTVSAGWNAPSKRLRATASPGCRTCDHDPSGAVSAGKWRNNGCLYESLADTGMARLTRRKKGIAR